MRTIAALRQAELVSLAEHAAKGLSRDGADTALVIVYDATGLYSLAGAGRSHTNAEVARMLRAVADQVEST